ncbi:hypothetical protein KFE96_17875 [Kordiimonas sp. SCSIO 12603]|uniref:hypothetical protein n=1 Tax=Kordiimonas sp. SCSIO 12603 TaxID=2829596 RepID=UPI002101F8B8|nr:hypothetical protein [Kordiimonas sp. SCSIO 12603]UTW58661.1 hypothetical protein KFE96_17875 [Kordiimonas sp. SCSIO 12603]
MAKDIKAVHEMLDYTKQLRLHTEGRRALHIRLSVLEKHLQEEHYRRFAAASFRTLKTDYGAASFSLPNNDLVLIVKDARVDVIDPMLNQVRLKFKEASALRTIDPIQGVSDAFVEWFDLEAEYDVFTKYVAKLAQAVLEGKKIPASRNVSASKPKTKSKAKPDVNPDTGLIKIAPQGDAGAPLPSEPPQKMKVSKIESPARKPQSKKLDPEMLLTLTKAITSADVGGLLRRQCVMAILGIQAPQMVMVHRWVPQQVVFDTFLKSKLTEVDPWLSGFLEDLIATRVLASDPNMENENSLASSLKVTAAGVLAREFDKFEEGLGNQSRGNIVLEFSSLDVTSNFAAYLAAREKLQTSGFKSCIAGVDPRALAWLNLGNLQSDFLKVMNPASTVETWLDRKEEDRIISIIEKIGSNRIILEGCHSSEDIILGQRLGITMFQGEAVDPSISN